MTRQLHHELTGPSTAPLVLLVHGFTSSARSWSSVITHLAGRVRVLTVDLLGHGRTGGPAADAPEQARAVAELLDGLGLDGVTAVGHSFGADVVCELAVISDRVSRIVVVAQAPDYTDAHFPRGAGLMASTRSGPTVFRAARPGLALLAAGLRRRTPSGPLGAMAPVALGDLLAMAPGMFQVVLAERRERLAARPLDTLLTRSGHPSLVVLGGKDHFYGDRPAERYRRAGARVEILPAAGHAVPVQCPAELAELIAGFAAPGHAGR